MAPVGRASQSVAKSDSPGSPPGTAGANPSYALGSVKPGLHANLGSKSSLHLRRVVEPLEPPGKCQSEPLKQSLLLSLWLRHVPQAHRGADAAC